jgi:hypothetical protein
LTSPLLSVIAVARRSSQGDDLKAVSMADSGIGRESLADFGSRTMPDLQAGGMAMDGSGTARLATTARNVAK